MADMLGHDSLALGGWDLVVNVDALDLGDGVAVLDLDGDELDLGVVDAVLGDDLTASVGDGGLDGVSNSMGNWGNNSWGSGQRGGDRGSGVSSEEVLRIGLGFGLSLSLGDVVGGNSWGITDDIGDLLADLLVLNLLGLNGLGVAHVLGGWGTGLGGQDLDLGLAVGGWDNSWGNWSNSGSIRSSSEELRVSLSISCWLGTSKGKESRNGNNLKCYIFF